MSDTASQTNPTTPAEPTSGPESAAVNAPARRMTVYIVIALISVAIGAAGAVATLRYVGPPSATSTPFAPGTAASAKPDAMAGMKMTGEADSTDETKGVYISPARQQLIGVRTADVTQQTLDTTIRTVGTLAYDETRVTEIHPKVSGWVERVFVDFVGKPVRRGQPLLTLYSPDLVATQNEYLLAVKAQGQLGSSSFAETRSGAESLVAATRDRLRLWDITDEQIEELERTGKARRTMTLYSPFDGIVMERKAFAGQYITPETSTAKIADLANIWAIGQIFEYEAQRVKPGDPAVIEFPYGQAARSVAGRVTFIYPDINPETRRARVRVEFRNPGLEFKPETYVTVVLKRTAAAQLAVPKEAVLDNGAKRYAILARENGYFEPREIEVGEPVDQFFPLVKGLAEGDRVVTSAQFLIDSETNLKAALGAMANMPGMNMGGQQSGAKGGSKGVDHSAHPAPKAEPPAPVPSGHQHNER